MDKSEFKKILKPLIKECIKEVIFEDGILSGLITEVARGLNSVSAPQINSVQRQQVQPSKSESVLEAKKQLNEVKSQLQKASGLEGIFEGTTPMAQKSNNKNSQYGALRDTNPGDAGINIDGLIKMTGGWSQVT